MFDKLLALDSVNAHDILISFTLLKFADLTVTVEHELSPNFYRVKVNDGEWRQVEASLQTTEKGLRLNTLIGDKKSNVGILTHEQQVHVYDEVKAV